MSREWGVREIVSWHPRNRKVAEWHSNESVCPETVVARGAAEKGTERLRLFGGSGVDAGYGIPDTR